MEYITVKEAAEKWGVSVRRVQFLCTNGRIKGVVRFGHAWKIPKDAVLPNMRKKGEPTLPMPRKCPFLDMTNLYNKAGCADECGEMLVNNPEAYELFKAQIEYRQGRIANVYKHARYFLDSHSGFYAILGAGMLLANVAIWSGDIEIWREAKRHICDAPCKTDQEREIVSLSLAIIDSSIYDNKDYPEWFKIGNFETLPADSHPAAKVYYVKYIYMAAFDVALNQTKLEGMSGLSFMRIIPNIIEPLISQAVVDKTVIPEIYLRFSCAVAYYNSGKKEDAVRHIDKALDLALPDKLFGLLAEYIRHFGGLLEERISLKDADALEAVKSLYAAYNVGWSRLSGQIRQRFIATNLTQREREIAKLTAFGFKSKEIANKFHISESTVKHEISRIVNKAGLVDAKEFPLIL